MNTNEAAQFLQAVARAYPGKVGVTRDAIAQWAHDLADIDLDDANLAWAAHRAVCPHPVTTADIRNHHRPHTHRPELDRAQLDMPEAHASPEVARAALADMRARLAGSSPTVGWRR